MLDVTEQYTQECYNNYYKKQTDYDAYYEHLAEIEDRNYQDEEEE